MEAGKKLKAVYFGTPDFSVPALETLFNHDLIDLKYVVSMPDRPSGRGHQLKSPEVIDFAKKHEIKFFQTNNINKEESFKNKLKNEDIDIFIVLAFAQFLKQDLLDTPSIGCFNIHTSLLPKYRGAAPIQYALLNGDKSTGVSIQKMVLKMDAGDLVWSTPVDIDDNETGGTLYNKLKLEAASSLSKFLIALNKNEITYTPQDEDNVSIAPTLKKSDGHLNFKEQTSFEIKNRIKALDPWPGTFCYLNKKRMKVFEIEESNESLSPGSTKIAHKEIHVGTKDKSIRLSEVQLEGKKRCSDTELLNGIRDEIIINP